MPKAQRPLQTVGPLAFACQLRVRLVAPIAMTLQPNQMVEQEVISYRTGQRWLETAARVPPGFGASGEPSGSVRWAGAVVAGACPGPEASCLTGPPRRKPEAATRVDIDVYVN